MRPIRRAKLALLGGAMPHMAQRLFRGNKETEFVLAEKTEATTNVRTTLKFQRGRRLIEASQAAEEKKQNSKNDGSEVAVRSNSVVLGAMPLVVNPPVREQDFIDALTAVMVGKVAYSDDGDDEHSLSTVSAVSTIDSGVERTPAVTKDEALTRSANQSLAIGKLFFYLEQQSPARKLPPSTEIALPPPKLPETCDGNSSPQLEVISLPSTSAEEEEHSTMQLDNSVSNLGELFEAKSRESDRDGLFEIGNSFYRKGEVLLYEGKVEEAREVLQRARSFQKRSLRLITMRMAQSMHKQGLDHCKRGDKYLSVILLGIAEILKHTPTPANLHLGVQVYLGYSRICPKEPGFQDLRNEIGECVRIIEKESLQMAKTLQTYSKCLAMGS